MFTGIVEELGDVLRLSRNGDSAVLTIRAGTVAEDVKHGASIAVNGVCLTVVGQRPEPAGMVELDFDVMAETLNRSVIGDLSAGDQVNLERAARVDSRLDGHIVQGHVDGTAVVQRRTPGTEWESFRFALPSDLARYVAEKGSIAVHGVSLTVTAVGADYFEVGLIPETLRATNLGSRQIGDPVNLEVDVLAKYTERLLAARLGNMRSGGEQ
ncbi:riboflavin synthase [Jatrophihabitans telluris]|uniref:Riboflavin synthase n=1 Tax=Jatrophihabitans telluris TaxID=2038343 RepID=A0ABY4R4Q7_9ACTN|nr:riboflavin synthase [Jatrophihabitans telluris]UQX90072.1 riboflavin synthase [Jatrophihabitans telluris]